MRRTYHLNSMRPARRIAGAFFFGFASLGSWMPTLTVWLEEHHVSGRHIGYIASMPWLVMLIVQPLWGTVADKVGKQRCFTLTALVATGLLAINSATGFHIGIMIMMTVLVALFNSPVLPLLDSMTLDFIEANPGRSYSFLRFWGAPGFATGAFVTASLSTHLSIDVMFISSALFLFLTWIAIYRIPVRFQQSTTQEPWTRGVETVMKNAKVLIFLGIILLVSVAQSSSSFYLVLYLREIKSTSEITGTALAVQALSELPFYFVAAWLIRRSSLENILLIAIFGTALRLFLYSVNQEPFFVIGIEMLNGVTWTLLWISSVEYINAEILPQWRTTGQSLLWAAYFGAGAVAGNILTGRLYESMPMRQVFGYNSLLVGIVGVFAFMLLKSFRAPATRHSL